MPTDEELIGLVAEGDQRALEDLLHRYERPLTGFIARQTGDRDVEDLYQETWMRVVRHASRFERSKRFSTWMFQIAVNLCRDWHRRRPPDPTPASDPGGATDLGRAEAGLDATRLLAELPEQQREVVVLRYYYDLSEDDMASILGCPKGTVKSRLHHALARLGARVRREAR